MQSAATNLQNADVRLSSNGNLFMSTPQIRDFEELLKSFSKLPKARQRPKTLLEISGYPHFENVASNILAFFFCPTEDHGFGSRVLRSLLSLVESQCDSDLLADFTIYREAVTSGGNRLDILAESSDLVIGVENKIFAPGYNDWKDYSDFLEQKANATGKPPIKIVLCLRKEGLDPDHGFRMISYDEFSECLLKNIGTELLDANPRYLALLLDFVNTMKNRKTGTHMDPNLVEFFKKNLKTIVELYRQAENLRSELEQKTDELKQDMKIPPGIRPRSYNKVEEGYDYFYSTVYCEVDIPDGIRLVLEVTVRRKEGDENDGWQIYAHARKGSQQQQVNDWLKKKKIPRLTQDSGDWIYAECPFNESVESVRTKYEELINRVYKAL